MAEYIELEALRDALYDADAITMNGVKILNQFPSSDVAPVKHGLWVDRCVRDWRCSECGEKIRKVRNVDGYCYDDKPNYCPNCGARMDGDGNG